jgi:hypothetical protein
MNAPLLVAERREARLLSARAVTLVFRERFGRAPRRSAPLYDMDPLARLALVSEIELKLGVTFRDEDIEFVETEGDLIERGAIALTRAGA